MSILTIWHVDGRCRTSRRGTRTYRTGDYARARRWQQEGRTVRELRCHLRYADGSAEWHYPDRIPGTDTAAAAAYRQRQREQWLDLCHAEALDEEAAR